MIFMSFMGGVDICFDFAGLLCGLGLLEWIRGGRVDEGGRGIAID